MAKKRPPDRNAELSTKSAIRDKLLDIYKDVEKGYGEQRDRSDKIMDYWDLYNCKLNDNQFYEGNSKIYVPFVADAVDARKTRFTNQIFPQTGRYVEVITGDETLPQATMALLEGYVRRARIQTDVMPALCVNGDCEGQYTIYVGWKKSSRMVTMRDQVPLEKAGEAMEPVDDIVTRDEADDRPDVEVIHDADVLVLPVTATNVDDAIEKGGSVTLLRRWTKAMIKQMIEDGDFVESEGEALLEEMSKQAADGIQNPPKELADAAGIKDKGSFALGYETWSRLKVGDDWRLCRIYYGGEKRILGCKLCPYWCELAPLISVPVRKQAAVFKGIPPADRVHDLQIFANDTIMEGADTAHFSAMPIVMTDPEKNPRVGTMVLGLAAVWETNPQDTQFVEFPALWKDAWDRASSVRDQIFQTLGVNPSMIPSMPGDKKPNQAQVAQQQQVDILTTSDAVTVLSEGILTPMIQRFAFYDHQFRDAATTVMIYGEMGEEAMMEEVEPLQLNRRWEFKWWGVEAARNAAAQQQQMSVLNVIKEIPPNLYEGYELRMAPVITGMVESAFGARLARQIFRKKRVISLDPELENMMMLHGHRVQVHEADDDQQHIQVHMSAAEQDHHGTIREHVAMHVQQMQHKEMMQQQAAMGGQGGGGGPQPGAAVGNKHAPKGPAGSIHPDQMPAAGATTMPRKM